MQSFYYLWRLIQPVSGIKRVYLPHFVKKSIKSLWRNHPYQRRIIHLQADGHANTLLVKRHRRPFLPRHIPHQRLESGRGKLLRRTRRRRISRHGPHPLLHLIQSIAHQHRLCFSAPGNVLSGRTPELANQFTIQSNGRHTSVSMGRRPGKKGAATLPKLVFEASPNACHLRNELMPAPEYADTYSLQG